VILGEALAAPQVAGMVFVMGGISLLSRQRS
jgi:drug/metabolite transporter (DMT)-like permease